MLRLVEYKCPPSQAHVGRQVAVHLYDGQTPEKVIVIVIVKSLPIVPSILSSSFIYLSFLPILPPSSTKAILSRGPPQ